MYRLSNYTSEYNEKSYGKRKGSGIGLYVHNDFVFNRNNKLCRCTKNIECLFITISSTDTPITVGVVYRHHSGSIKDFLTEWEGILEELPEKNVIIMGDFNIDLLRPNVEFESILYGNNVIPTISMATHEKPGCKPSLIDNIFINTSEYLESAGILEHKISHHSPIFCFLNYCNPPIKEEEFKCPKYDYCESNINNFLDNINISIYEQNYQYNDESFTKFVDQIKNLIEENFRADEHKFKKSRRNFYVNPWV